MEGKPFAPLFDAPTSVGSACNPRVDLEAMAGGDGAARQRIGQGRCRTIGRAAPVRGWCSQDA